MPVDTIRPSSIGDNLLPSLLRTLVPVMVGFVLGIVGSNVTGVDEESLTVTFSTAITVVYYVVLRLLEQKWPRIGILLGSSKKPIYNGAKVEG